MNRALPPRRVYLLIGAILALLLQSLSPPGYMPGNLSSGWPVVLCPEGLPADFLGHAHHNHNAADPASAHADQGLGGHCPLGGMLDTVSASSLAGIAAAEFIAPAEVRHTYQPALTTRARSHPPRGPPVAA